MTTVITTSTNPTTSSSTSMTTVITTSTTSSPSTSTTTRSVQDLKSLVVAIVLPIIAFLMFILIIALVVWMCLRYRLLKRHNENDNQSESSLRIPRISRLLTYAQVPPETLSKAKPQEESSLPDYTFDYAKNQHETIESRKPEVNKDSNELAYNQFKNDQQQPNASNKTANLSNVYDDEDNNDTARLTHKDESLREIQELDNDIDNLSFNFEDTSEDEDSIVEAINPNVVVSIFCI
jgi:hypothetical protein